MKILIQKIMEAIERGENAVLCTVLASSGSAPRGAGARMAVFADGTTLGTVGGGRVELLAARDAKEILKGGEDCVPGFVPSTSRRTMSIPSAWSAAARFPSITSS